MSTWNHVLNNEFDLITPHDCFTDKITCHCRTLTFSLSDGFWVSHLHPLNSSDKTVRTDASEIRIISEASGNNIPLVYIFKPVIRFGKTRFCRRDIISIEELADQINSKKWSLELLNIYRDGGLVLLKGMIHIPKKHSWECDISLSFDKVEYCFNELRYEMTW